VIQQHHLRLFILRRGKHGEPLRDDDHTVITFNDKTTAKQWRDKLGGTYVVSHGPDHHKTTGIRATTQGV
jgi:hypothetical protein